MSYSKSAQKLELTYQFIKDFIAKYNYPPSVREICNSLGFKSTASAQFYLKKLEENGLIRKSASKNRTIEIVDDEREMPQDKSLERVPFWGNIAAGEPLLAGVEVDTSFALPTDFFNVDERSFLLKVRGNSMMDMGILDGDMVLIRQQSYANNGDIVVAQINHEEVTLKRFFKEKDVIRLHPENSMMDDIIVTPDQDFAVLGVISGLLRNNIR